MIAHIKNKKILWAVYFIYAFVVSFGVFVQLKPSLFIDIIPISRSVYGLDIYGFYLSHATQQGHEPRSFALVLTYYALISPLIYLAVAVNFLLAINIPNTWSNLRAGQKIKRIIMFTLFSLFFLPGVYVLSIKGNPFCESCNRNSMLLSMSIFLMYFAAGGLPLLLYRDIRQLLTKG